MTCCSLQGFVKAWKQPHETTKPKHRWERIDEALEIDAPAWSSTHIFLTDAYVYISEGRQNISSAPSLSDLKCLQRPRTALHWSIFVSCSSFSEGSGFLPTHPIISLNSFLKKFLWILEQAGSVYSISDTYFCYWNSVSNPRCFCFLMFLIQKADFILSS